MKVVISFLSRARQGLGVVLLRFREMDANGDGEMDSQDWKENNRFSFLFGSSRSSLLGFSSRSFPSSSSRWIARSWMRLAGARWK